jgi:hypothetical protein
MRPHRSTPGALSCPPAFHGSGARPVSFSIHRCRNQAGCEPPGGAFGIGHPPRTSRLVRFVLPAVILIVMSGCASVPSYRECPDLPHKAGGIRTVGLLPPVIAMSEEQARFGANRVVPNEAWSEAADQAVSAAFAREMAAVHVPLVPIALDDADVKELAALYAAVDFSIRRHSWETKTGVFPPQEPFAEKLDHLDYSLGAATGIMERYQVDAIWVVRGFNLLPTAGAQAKHGAEVTLAVLAALGGVAVPVTELRKIELRAALIGRDGTVLYYGLADERAGSPEPEPPATAGTDAEGRSAGSAGESTYIEVDLRDQRAARHYVAAALAGYQAAKP